MLAAVAGALGLSAGGAAGSTSPNAEAFPAWLAEFEAEARGRGISAQVVESALSGVEPRLDILEQDRSQPKKPGDFCGYMVKRLSSTRIERGRRLLEEHADLLAQINREYGVPARYLVSLWGLESNFGDYLGDYPVMQALLTLAYDPRRSDLFREQAFDALRILEEGHVSPEDFKGSWAGAFGQVQFMPTTFRAYAVDHDGDGRVDLWGSEADALASAAAYLRQIGWRSGETWGRPVALPDDLRAASRELERRRGLDEWSERGVRQANGASLPDSTLRGRIVLPRREGDPAFLVYGNYETFLNWNRSTFFAVSVGTLADAVIGRHSLFACGLQRS